MERGTEEIIELNAARTICSSTEDCKFIEKVKINDKYEKNVVCERSERAQTNWYKGCDYDEGHFAEPTCILKEDNFLSEASDGCNYILANTIITPSSCVTSTTYEINEGITFVKLMKSAFSLLLQKEIVLIILVMIPILVMIIVIF